MYNLKILSAADMPQADTFLTAREQEYYSALKIDKRKTDYSLGRYTLKKLLAEKFVNAPLKDIEILKSPTGAPELYVGGEKSRVKVSISHSNGVAAAVASTDAKAIGVDIELIEPHSKKWAEFSFHPSEIMDITDEFLVSLWAQKEAVLKVIGTGLSASLHDIRVLNGEVKFYGKLAARTNKIKLEVSKEKNFMLCIAEEI